MRSPPLTAEDWLPRLDFWSLIEIEERRDGLPRYQVHGRLRDHQTLEEGFHLTGFVMGFDHAEHRWVETTTGFYRLGRALGDAKPPQVYIHRRSK